MCVYIYNKVYSNIIDHKYKKCKLKTKMSSSSRINKENMVYSQN